MLSQAGGQLFKAARGHRAALFLIAVLFHVGHARLFDRQLHDQARANDQQRQEHRSDPRDPLGVGPFARLMSAKEFQQQHAHFYANHHRQKAERDEDFVNDSSSLLMDTFHLLDVSNVSEQFVNVFKAFLLLMQEVYQTLEKTVTMPWIFKQVTDNKHDETESAESSPPRRLSMVVLSWIIVATVTILGALVIRRAIHFWTWSKHRKNNDKALSAKKKFVTFDNDSNTLITPNDDQQQTPTVTASLPTPGQTDVEDGTASRLNRLAARWVNHVLARMDDRMGAVVLKHWINAINQLISVKDWRGQVNSIEFREIPAMAKPTLSNVFVTHQNAITYVTADFSLSVLQFRVILHKEESSEETYMIVHDLKTSLCVDIHQDVVKWSMSVRDGEPMPEIDIPISSPLSSMMKAAMQDALNFLTMDVPIAEFGIPAPFENILPPSPDEKEKTILDCLEVFNLKLCNCSGSIKDEFFVTLSFDGSPEQETWRSRLLDESTIQFPLRKRIHFYLQPEENNTSSEKLIAKVWREQNNDLIGQYAFRGNELRHPRDQQHVVRISTDQKDIQIALDIKFKVLKDKESPVKKCVKRKKLLNSQGQMVESVRYSYEINEGQRMEIAKNPMLIWTAAVDDLYQRRKLSSTDKDLTPERSTMTIRSMQRRASNRRRRNSDSVCITTLKEIPSPDFDDSDSESVVSNESVEVEYDLIGWRGKISKSWESLKSDHLNVPNLSIPEDSLSLSEMSAVSSTSNRLSGQLGQSLLILEVEELGMTRHYLIPKTLLRKSKLLKRKGLKLHVAANHVFVAKHLKSSTTCNVCGRKIVKRLGKSAYVCRDCDLTCHKNCHAKIGEPCQKSSFPKMELLRGSTIV